MVALSGDTREAAPRGLDRCELRGVFEQMSVGRLSGKEFNGYLVIRLPHERDSVVEHVVADYRSGTGDRRRQLLDEITPRAAGVLSAFGQRAASMAVRKQSAEVLLSGLIAMGMADGRLEDYRYNLIVLAAVNDSADRLGRSLGELVDVVGPDLPVGAEATFRDFVAREPRHKSLEAMRLHIIGSGDSFLYR
jgi:hypothetical protein